MARNPTKRKSPSDESRPEVIAEDGVQPLKAIHHIVYGAAQTAVPNSFFVPVSESERDELLACGAAVELDEIEAAVLGAAPKTDEGETPATTEPTDDAAETPASDSDVIE